MFRPCESRNKNYYYTVKTKLPTTTYDITTLNYTNQRISIPHKRKERLSHNHVEKLLLDSRENSWSKDINGAISPSIVALMES